MHFIWIAAKLNNTWKFFKEYQSQSMLLFIKKKRLTEKLSKEKILIDYYTLATKKSIDSNPIESLWILELYLKS